MPVAASEIFEFLEQQEPRTVERHVIACPAFGTLRRNLRKIALHLLEPDDQEALSVSNGLQVLLSKWLTVPIPFDHSMLTDVTNTLGQTETVQNRWGSDIRVFYDNALCAANDLSSIENPTREMLRAAIRKLRTQERMFKIYCHRRGRPYFDSILVPPENLPLSEDAFLHSVRDYRESQPFDVLIKFGPLRTRGWGSAPDALLTAPRFSTLFHIVWSGCSDDADFGYDPVSPSTDVPRTDGVSPSASERIRRGPMDWNLQVKRVGEDLGAPAEYTAEDDELRVFRVKKQPTGRRQGLLVQIDEEYGILYPPNSQVLSFDPDSAVREPIDQRIPGETLVEGMFLITPLVDNVDLGGTHAEQGHYSKIWRTKLEQQWQADSESLVARLYDAGLKLVHLNSAIRHWCEPPGTVIHAPQQMKHFEILIRVLGVGNNGNDRQEQKRSLRFWQRAWDEIRRSRGEAIQTGVQEHEIVREQHLVILKKLLPQIREKASVDDYFSLAIPFRDEIKGAFFFRRVRGIEEGFCVPETEFKAIRELTFIDQWRD
ncbi:MAG: hypothetical protein R3B95_17910 [Nitrospirales bacterium]|nr:hypothetical protein [Nitrospirales bacterium]